MGLIDKGKLLESIGSTTPKYIIYKTYNFQEVEPETRQLPVKKTWTLKKEYIDFCVDLKLIGIESIVNGEIDDKVKKYYDYQEQVNYSQIPKGSLCNFDYLYCNKEVLNAINWFNCCDSKNVSFYANGYNLTVDRCNIKNFRVVEWGKE